MFNSLTALSPLDGRYRYKVEDVSEYFSEYNLIRCRLITELSYFEFFRREVLDKPLTKKEKSKLSTITDNFNPKEAQKIKLIEKETRHDVKAVEYYLKECFIKIGLDFSQYLHFGLTSEDTNSIAYGILLSEAKQYLIIPDIELVISKICELAEKYQKIPMMGRTHGQAAVPTTIGKELVVFADRINKEKLFLQDLKIDSKLNGAIGNYNALQISFPKIDWTDFSFKYIKSLGLEPNLVTTQILPSDSYCRLFQIMSLINTIIIGFTQDMWRYVSDGYFVQKVIDNEIGSSTMPQKVNPIDFENSEGNLGLANTLFAYFCAKLPISRLQRDLSDSTVKRNFGIAFGYSILGYRSLIEGLNRISPNQARIYKELDNNWACITEAIQIVLRTLGDNSAYEKVKDFSRGKSITGKDIQDFIRSLSVKQNIKKQLLGIKPDNYIGLAPQIVKDTIDRINLSVHQKERKKYEK
jgi:adenylosuccinate lyase